ncbi:hypothetical protein HN958_04740 [Candidatus Falkowbacteria bacterium]|jgi:hypothetical protein|nr:hypothetical protein [Candidatus Falkowbacteria bacterium]
MQKRISLWQFEDQNSKALARMTNVSIVAGVVVVCLGFIVAMSILFPGSALFRQMIRNLIIFLVAYGTFFAGWVVAVVAGLSVVEASDDEC